MISLLPVEYWHYTVGDVLRGLTAALASRRAEGPLPLPGLGECLPTRSARAALVIALRALALPRAARVGVPLYCCPVVFKAVQEAGCRPRFLDIEPSTYCLSAEDLHRKRSSVDAVIAAHMFGNLCDLPALQEAARGRPIIEDCAQSLGSMLGGRMSGALGSMAVFSFRSGKYLSVGEGGALFSTRADLAARAAELVSALPAPSGGDEALHLALTYLRSKLRSRPLFGLIGGPLWSLYNKTVDYTDKSPIVMAQAYSSDLATARRRLSLLESVIRGQRANADFFARTLRLPASMLCREEPGTFYNRYLYPLCFPEPAQRDFLAGYLHKRQITTARPYRDIAEVAARHYGYAGDCPVAEKVAGTVLVIPSYHGLGEREVQRIARCVNAGWEQLLGGLGGES